MTTFAEVKVQENHSHDQWFVFIKTIVTDWASSPHSKTLCEQNIITVVKMSKDRSKSRDRF